MFSLCMAWLRLDEVYGTARKYEVRQIAKKEVKI